MVVVLAVLRVVLLLRLTPLPMPHVFHHDESEEGDVASEGGDEDGGHDDGGGETEGHDALEGGVDAR